MTATAIEKGKHEQGSFQHIRKEIVGLVTELHDMREKADKKLVRLSDLVHKVQKEQLFRNWTNPKTRKLFTSFEDWIREDVRQSKASVYRFIGVKEHLKLPDSTLEKIGASRCFELVKVAKEKPKMLQRIVKEIDKNPDLPLFTLQQMVTSVLSGGHFDSGQYERIDFAVKVEDSDDVHKAFVVMQSMEPVKNPEAASGRGLHLLNLCQEFLSQKEARAALKRLEDAGAFKVNGNSNFRIEE